MKEESYQQKVFKVIQSLTGEKNLLTTPRELIKFVGDLHAGIFLGQLIYWTDKGTREDGFIYKSSKEWQEEIYLSDYSIRKARKILVDMGILEVKLKKANGNPTIHYKLDREAFIDRLFKFQQKGDSPLLENQKKESKEKTKGNVKINESLTKTTTDITTKTTQISSEEEKIYLKFKNSTKNNQITISQKEKLKEFISTYTAELVLKAIDETIMRASIFNLNYLETLLNDWKSKGIQTVNQVDTALKSSSYSSKKSIQNKESTFNNFEQRTYDFEDLEKKLLGIE